MPDYSFDHVHLNSTDPRNTAEFYKEMFGAKQINIHEGNGRVTVILNLNGTTIIVSKPRGESQQVGIDHFGIITDDLGAAIKKLKAKGVTFTQDETEIRQDFKISFLSAPENVRIELQEGRL